MAGASKVGLLVVVFAALLVGAYAFLNRSVFAPETTTYYADLPDAGGVASGARVLMAGVPVGQVSGVALKGPREARLTLTVQSGLSIPQGTVVVLPSSLLSFGDRQVELVPPSTPDGSMPPALPAKAVLAGSLRSPLASLAPESESTLKELNLTLAAARKLLEDPALKGQTTSLLKTSEETVKQFGRLAKRLDETLATNDRTLQAALMDGRRILANVEVTSQAVANYARSGKLEGQVDGLVARLNTSLDAGNALVSDLRGFVNDPELRGGLETIVDNTKTITADGTQITKKVDQMATNGVQLTETANEIATKASALADDARGLMQKFDRAIDRFTLPGSDGAFSNLGVEARQFYETRPDRWRTDVLAHVPFRKGTVQLGLYDAFESNKLILQYESPFRLGAYRYGVYASKPGFGVDFRLAPGVRLTSNVYGINDMAFDAFGRVSFGRGIEGWFGVQRIFQSNAPALGVSARW